MVSKHNYLLCKPPKANINLIFLTITHFDAYAFDIADYMITEI
jgi:hypothetical protein